VARASAPLRKLLDTYGYLSLLPYVDNLFNEQENRYVKLISDANPMIAQKINEFKNTYYKVQSRDKIPLLHGLGLEATSRRYYQYGSFLSNVLGYVDKNGDAFYGIEQYFDSLLRGHDGKIVGRASAWIGPVGANEFNIQDVQDGNDVYLTVDVGIQKEAETVIKKYYDLLRADSISVLVFDPINGQIKASANLWVINMI
jgi:cell division protein FtsI/penicillin-binding protein 2